MISSCEIKFLPNIKWVETHILLKYDKNWHFLRKEHFAIKFPQFREFSLQFRETWRSRPISGDSRKFRETSQVCVYGVHCRKAPKREGRSINFRCFKDIDNDDFRDDIINAPWEHVLNCHDVNDAWSIWHSTFMSIINHRAPMKSKRIRGNSLSWLDGEIIKLMRQRDHAHKIAKCSGSQNNWDVYKSFGIRLRNKFAVRKVNTL